MGSNAEMVALAFQNAWAASQWEARGSVMGLDAVGCVGWWPEAEWVSS